MFWLLLPTPRKTFDPPTFLLIVTLIDSRHPKVSIMLCDLTFNISVSRPFSHNFAQMSCQVPKNLHFTETILTFAPFEATLRRMCAGERTGKKLSHNSASQIHFPPRWAGGRHGLQCAPCSAPKMSKNHSRPLLLTGGDRHFFTDTLCPIPAVNCCCCPDFLEIRFVLQRNLIFPGAKSCFQSHKSICQLLNWPTVSRQRRCEAYCQSRLS